MTEAKDRIIKAIDCCNRHQNKGDEKACEECFLFSSKQKYGEVICTSNLLGFMMVLFSTDSKEKGLIDAAEYQKNMDEVEKSLIR